jgi:hypothetical protein
VTGVRHHPAERGTQLRCNFQQKVIVWREAASPFSAINFDQRTGRLSMRRNLPRHVQIVGQDNDGSASGVQLSDLFQLLWSYAYCVEDICDAVPGEIFCLC